MPLFISDAELAAITATTTRPAAIEAVVEKADAVVRALTAELDRYQAAADAAEQNAALNFSHLEGKFLSLSSEYDALNSRAAQLDADLERRASELAAVRAEKHQLHLKLIEKDGEIERHSTEVAELQKSKRQLVELVGMKDTEISEKNSIIKNYLDKITDLSDRAAQREARLCELEADLVRCRANADKLLQEKELIEKHNSWLNDELTEKVNSLMELRRRNAESEAEMSAKLADMEKQYNECFTSLSRQKARVGELESKLEALHHELCSAKDDAAAAEQRFSVEISTVSKLVDLYKESSEAWSKKAGELEGVIKALETHLSQVEGDYKDKLEKEIAAKNEAEKECTELKERLAKCETELEASRKANELDILPLSSVTAETLMHSTDSNDDTRALVPHVPAGVSGTALAASLLREGWSLAKMYAKYQEAADALRHEQLGRKQTQAILERVLLEIEEKASVLLDERAEHERMAEAYALMNQKLQQSVSEQANFEKVIRELKADLKRHEREYDYAQKEIADLQKQVTILLKECRDIQLRCGSVSHEYTDDDIVAPMTEISEESGVQKVISEHLLSIKDIKGLVEQNAKLRSLVRSLSDEIENRDSQLKEQFDEELQKHKEEAASRVAAVLERAEEQAQMIESLHSSVAMYRRLYEEEHKLHPSQPHSSEVPSANGRKDFMLLLEGSQEAAQKVQEQASERVRCLEEELSTQKMEIISLRAERDKLALEANFAQEKLERFMKEFDQQREEMNGVLARNIEFSQLIVDYQKKLRESSESLSAAEELSRKFNMELSVLKREKELLISSEKRAFDEVQDLSQRVHRLQATLDTIQSAEQIREEARVAERKKQEDYVKQIEREWAEAKKELQEERNNVRTLSLERENIRKDAMRQVEDMGKELAAASQAVTSAEARAAVAEARCADLERNLRSHEVKDSEKDGGLGPSNSSAGEFTGELTMAKQEIERLKAEAQANKDHMLQYKSIAEVNEVALKQIEGAHENFKVEAEQLRKSLEAEIQSLRDRILELENESYLKFQEAASAASQKDEALASVLAEVTNLKEETSSKVSQIMALEVQVTVLKQDLEREHQRACAAQANYERQVILQSETIQELTKTSQALASLQEEASTLRQSIDAYKSENNELKSRWDVEKLQLEKSKAEAEKKYDELNEQNRILHSQLEVMHIKLAEKDVASVGVTSAGSSADSQSESGLQSVVSYLRRSKEIAETEISLLKQEKLRLQSQLERASKAAEAAEASLSAERANSRSLLFTEDEFKALKLQVSEMNLLRESNMQLREENKHNFEECQKLREVAENAKVEAEKLQNVLRDRGIEAESLRKEIESQKIEKENLEKKISELLEKSKNTDLEDSNRLKREIEQMQASMRERDCVIEETRKQVAEKDEVISKLEQDLARTRSELSERDNRVSQLEKQRRSVLLNKQKVDSLSKENQALTKEKESLLKERESLLKERESLLKERETLANEKETLLKEREVLSREKDELGKENQAVTKQLEDLRHEKKTTGDALADSALREKEKEKDTRIHILENTVGRLREENKRKEEKRLKFEKVILEKVHLVDKERKKFELEHGKHKDAVKKLSDELEKLKHARESLPEGTSVVQLLSGCNLDDLASTYVLAIESFEREAHSILNNVVNQASVGSSSTMDTTTFTNNTEALPSEGPIVASSTVPPSSPAKATGEREKKVSLPKTTVETRKTGRKLVRPRLLKPEEPQRDVDMSELDASKSLEKPNITQEMTVQPSVSVTVEPPIRKRPASPSASELQEESFPPGVPLRDSIKRSKGSEVIQEDVQGHSVDFENVENIPTVEELLDAAANIPQGLTEDVADFGKDDFGTLQGQGKEYGESLQLDESGQVDLQRDTDMFGDEHAGKPIEAEPMLDEGLNSQAEQETQQQNMDVEEKEEGELVPEGSDFDGGDDIAVVGSQDANEVQPEHSEAFLPSPARNDDDPADVTVDVNEMNSPDVSNANEQNEEGEIADDVGEDSDKSTEGNDETVGDADHNNEESSGAAEGNVIAAAESSISREESPATVTGTEATHPSQAQAGSRTIILSERARLRAAERLGRSPAAPSGSSSAPTPAPAARRGRAPLTRSRGGRGARGGRRQSSGGQS